MTTTTLNLIILILTASFGWLTIAYEGYANMHGLTVGSWLSGPFTWFQGIAYIALIVSVILSFFTVAWWAPAVVLIAGNILVRIMLPTMKANSQIVAMVGVFVGLLLSVFIVWL
ncbi:hypothetical protein [Rhodohalobacter sp. 8-1]|uniref:hypothetical protein n=1 Tax=Rhodohalobacter sp. 8-1 TaxID=3131972 RepID=UPI0030EE9F52